MDGKTDRSFCVRRGSGGIKSRVSESRSPTPPSLYSEVLILLHIGRFKLLSAMLEAVCLLSVFVWYRPGSILSLLPALLPLRNPFRDR